MSGKVRVDRRTKDLCLRLRRGEIAVIDHADLDPAAAYALAERHPAAVVNAARSITGRYPNGGPAILLDARIPLLDACGSQLLENVREGLLLTVDGNRVLLDGREVAHGTLLKRADVDAAHEVARRNLAGELEAFSRNTLEFLSREKDVALGDLVLPPLEVSFRNRPVLVVARGQGYKQDLQSVRSFIREQKPVLAAVDGGADALLEAGLRPDLILGDMDSASDAALRCGAELVVHAYPDGRPCPGLARTERLGLSAHLLPAPGTSEDAAMLLAHQAGASLIVAVGTHFSMVEFLDKHRAGMASTFLTRLRVGSILVDAKGLSRLYRPAISPALVGGILASALLPVLVIVTSSPAVQRWFGLGWMGLEVWLRRHGLR